MKRNASLNGRALWTPLGLVVVLLIGSNVVQAAQVYMSTTGSDSTGNGSEGNPYATLKKSVAASSEGDSILVASGLYDGPDNVGVRLAQRRLMAQDSDDPPTFSCIEASSSFAAGITLGNDAVVQHVNIQSCYYGVQVSSTSVAVGSRLVVRNVSKAAVYVNSYGKSFFQYMLLVGQPDANVYGVLAEYSNPNRVEITLDDITFEQFTKKSAISTKFYKGSLVVRNAAFVNNAIGAELKPYTSSGSDIEVSIVNASFSNHTVAVESEVKKLHLSNVVMTDANTALSVKSTALDVANWVVNRCNSTQAPVTLSKANATIRGAEFVANNASKGGAAMELSDATVIVEKSVFELNLCKAVFTLKDSTLTLDDSNVKKNYNAAKQEVAVSCDGKSQLITADSVVNGQVTCSWKNATTTVVDP